MPSQALDELQTRIADVEELVLAHRVLTGGGRGRPAQRQGVAVTRAGIVLLAAALEAYVEDLFEEASRLTFADMSDGDFQKLMKNTKGRLNNADCFKIEMLFFNIGMPWALRAIRWRKFSNETVRAEINDLVTTRSSIAHGRPIQVNLGSLRRWKNMIEMFAPRLEERVAEHVQSVTGARPNW